MSGIAGVFRLSSAGDGTSGIDPALLDNIAVSLVARGPDGIDVWQEDGTALFHSLFETTGRATPEGQSQPFRSGDLAIIADVRIDARAELIAALRTEGVRVAAEDSDAAFLIAAYRAWGDACVTHIIGDFAFVIRDAPRRRVFAARDHFGVKPLYYAQTARDVIVSNTLETVLVHPQVSRVLDDEAVVNFLLFGYNTNTGSTMYAQIKCLPPGHSLVLENGTLRVQRYWSLPTTGDLKYAKPQEYVEHFSAIFDAAVADRMPANEFCVLMSGGTDSTAIAATACKLLASRAAAEMPNAVCGGFSNLFVDAEPSFAAVAAGALKMPFSFVRLDAHRAYDTFGAATRTPEPYDNPLFAAEHDLYAAAAARARVALTGYGGDAVLRETRSHLVRLVANGKPFAASREALEYIRLHHRIPRPGIQTWFKERRGALLERGRVPAWLQPDMARNLDVEARIAEVERRPRDVHPLRPEAFVHLAAAFWPRCYEECDMAVTRTQLEMRHPFMDVRLVDFALSIPPAQWYNDKGMLRLAMQSLLPPAIVRRPKAPLAGDPLRAVFKRDGAGWLGEKRVTNNVAQYVRTDELAIDVGGRAQRAPSRDLDADMRPLTLSLWLSS